MAFDLAVESGQLAAAAADLPAAAGALAQAGSEIHCIAGNLVPTASASVAVGVAEFAEAAGRTVANLVVELVGLAANLHQAVDLYIAQDAAPAGMQVTQ